MRAHFGMGFLGLRRGRHFQGPRAGPHSQAQLYYDPNSTYFFTLDYKKCRMGRDRRGLQITRL